jgi:pimeloyl-ACP methyl ester carboxylesterase
MGKSHRDSRYWRHLITLVILALVIPLFVVPMFIGGGAMWTLLHPGCGDGGTTPNAYHLATYREISIPARSGGAFRGFFVPGTKDGVIIVPPPYNSGRDWMLREAFLLADDGFSLLTFESRVCAGKGVLSLGYNEVEDVGDVLAYLKQNAETLGLNLDHMALHGFSSAGATSIMAAARYPEIRAILAEGGYDNIDEQLGIMRAGNFFESLMAFGARVTYRVATGQDVNVLVPVEAIKKIPPRPIFLVYGTQEVSLPGAREELAAARSVDPNTFIQLWEVPGANHGTYLAAVGEEEYKRWVLPYYNCALLSQCTVWDNLWKNP